MPQAKPTRARTAQVVKTYKTRPNEFDLIGPEIHDPAKVEALTEDSKVIRRHDWYGPFTHLVQLRDKREALVEIR